MPDTTTTGTPTVQPVTSQDVTPPATSQPDGLERQQSADTFKALSELFDATVTPPAPTPTPTPVTPAAPVPTPVTPAEPTPTPATPTASTTDDAFEKGLAEIKPPDRAHPNVQKGMDELRRISREEHKRALELEAKTKDYETKLADYEAKLKTPTVPDEVQKELEDLRNMRKELDLRLDPEFSKNYVKPVQDAEANIMRIFTEAGLKEETAQQILDKGGIVALSKSSEVLDPKTGLTASQWVNDVLLEKTPSFHRNRIIGELTNALNIQDRAQRELQDFQGNAKARYETRMQKLTEDFNTGRDAALAELGDLAKPRTAPPTASAEEQADVAAHNELLKKAEGRFNEYMKTSQDPKVAGAIMVRATQADVLLTENKALQARVAALQDTVNRIKAAGSTSQAGDHSAPIPAAPAQTPKDLLKLGDSKALGDLLTQSGVLR